ncbi:MAG: hypothetical protein CME06_16035 [Gemmatimonadetes bacterium]|nr:hypothetical protein [Gemmatimonadota bacterium]
MVHMEIQRPIFNRLRREMAEPQILVLTGPRQVGKTTLLRALERAGGDAGRRTRFFDLEQPSDLAGLRGDAQDLIDTLVADADDLFIDEFYYLAGAGQLFKAIYDRARAKNRKIKIVASGSSSVEIHSHLGESLAGRTMTYRIYPLSWEELSQWDSPARPDYTDFLRYGGLPGLATVADEERKQRLLQEYLSAYLFKDIKGLIKEENIRAFNHLLQLLAQNQGQLVEASSLARELRVSAPTIERYLSMMDQTYVNFLLPSYHTNLANELKKSRKTYLYDLGVRNSILGDFRDPSRREDRGAIFESAVFLTIRPLLTPNMQLRFWRTKSSHEVDFVVIRNRVPYPIEVKASLSEPKLPSGLAAFCRKYPKVTRTLTVSDRSFESRREGNAVHEFLPFSRVPEFIERIQREE